MANLAMTPAYSSKLSSELRHSARVQYYNSVILYFVFCLTSYLPFFHHLIMPSIVGFKAQGVTEDGKEIMSDGRDRGCNLSDCDRMSVGKRYHLRFAPGRYC